MDNFPVPDNVLFHILSFLSGEDLLIVRRVCSRWREFTEIKSLWEHVDITINGSIDQEQVKCLKLAPELRCINLWYLETSSCAEVATLLQKYPPSKVQELYFFDSKIRCSDFKKILLLFGANLKKLRMEHIDLCSLIDSGERWTDCKLPELKSLKIDPSFMKLLGPLTVCPWPKLQELTVHGANFTTYESLIVLSEVSLRKFYIQSCALEDAIRYVEERFQKFESLEEFGCLEHASSSLALRWNVGHLGCHILELFPGVYQQTEWGGNLDGKSCSDVDPYGDSDPCDDCLMFEAFTSFEIHVFAELIIYFTQYSHICLYKFLMSSVASEIDTKLTLHRKCDSECEKKKKIPVTGLYQLAMHAIEHIPKLETLCLAGCNRFLDFPRDFFESRAPMVKFEYKVTADHNV